MRPEETKPHPSLSDLEIISRTLDPEPEVLKEWGEELARWSEKFQSDLKKSRAICPNSASWKTSSFSKGPLPFTQVLSEATKRLIDSGVNTASGNFFGYVPGGGLPSAAVGDFIAALTNRYAGVYSVSPGAAGIENEVIRWLCDLFYGRTNLELNEPWGTLTSSGSLANLVGILAARETLPPTQWASGVIYYTDQVHLAISRSLRIAGLALVEKRHVSMDSSLRMDPAHLSELMDEDRRRGKKPWIIIASAGTTNTGAIDPISELAQITAKYGAWLHVDAAYGGMFLLTSPGRARLGMLNGADSVALDPHKGLFMPYGCGAVLVKHRKDLLRTFAETAEYLEDCTDLSQLSPADYSPELTRHFRGMRVWFSLKLLGIQAFVSALEEKIQLAKLASERIGQIESLETFEEPQLSVIAFRVRDSHGGDGATQRLLKRILDDGQTHFSSTRIQGRYYLRMCILSFRSHLPELQIAVDSIRAHL